MKNKLTLATVRAELGAYGIIITKKDGEYLVRVKGSPSGHGYFTSDLNDALATGRNMGAQSVLDCDFNQI